MLRMLVDTKFNKCQFIEAHAWSFNSSGDVSVLHLIHSEHHVEFIYVECEKGGIMVEVTDKSEAIVCTCQDDPVAVYEYCNLHGLWRAEL